jgi:copper homeostasis protein
MQKIFELACFNYTDALVAAEAGVGRIEMCKDYATGGLTPDPDEVYQLKKKFATTVFVMIQPRVGNYYYGEEFNKREVAHTIEAFKDAGADGFVFGAIRKNSTGQIVIDEDKADFFIQAVGDLPCTFHRAIQDVDDQKAALDKLISMGYKRILTSGKHGKAIDHFDHIVDLKNYAQKRIIILPGGGIRSDHADLFLQSGFNEIHSASVNSATQLDTEELNRMIKIVSEY